MKNHFTLKDFKITVIAGVVVSILWIPIPIFHEIGHMLVCRSDGYESTVFFDGIRMIIHCSEPPKNELLYFAVGGVFGVIASVMPLMIDKIRKNDGLLLGFVILGIMEAIKGILETFLHSWYVSEDSIILIPLLSIIFGVVLVAIVVKRINQNNG